MLQTLDFLKFPEELLFETNEFLTELYNVEISPMTLLKSDSAGEALLAILQNRKTHRKYFRWGRFSVS